MPAPVKRDNALVNRVPSLDHPPHCPKHGTSVQRIVIRRYPPMERVLASNLLRFWQSLTVRLPI